MMTTTDNSPAIEARKVGNTRLLRLTEILDGVPAQSYLQGAWTNCAGAHCAVSWWAIHHPERWKFLQRGPVLREESCPWFSIAKEFDMNSRELTDVFGVFGCHSTPDPKAAAVFIREYVDIRGWIPRWMLFPDSCRGAGPCSGVTTNCTKCRGVSRDEHELEISSLGRSMIAAPMP